MLQLLFTAVILDQEMHAELGTECLSFLRAGSEIRSLYQATMSLILKKKYVRNGCSGLAGCPGFAVQKLDPVGDPNSPFAAQVYLLPAVTAKKTKILTCTPFMNSPKLTLRQPPNTFDLSHRRGTPTRWLQVATPG